MPISCRAVPSQTNETVLTDSALWHLEAGTGMVRASWWVGRARDQLGFSPLGDCACALGKCLQCWVCFFFNFMFSLVSLVQQNNYQGPGFNNVRLETSLWNPCQHFPNIQLKLWNNRAWRRWSRDERLCIVLTPVSRTIHMAPEGLFVLMRTFPSTALLSRSSLTSCDPRFQYLLGAILLRACVVRHKHLSVLERLIWGHLHLPHAKLFVYVWLVCWTILGDAAVTCTLSLILLKPLLNEWSVVVQVTCAMMPFRWWLKRKKLIEAWRGIR